MQIDEVPTQTAVRDRLARPLRDLRISVIDNCNLRCTYCMPLEQFGERYQFLKQDQLLSFDEIVRLTRAFTRLGARKIRLTGGEPLLRKDLPTLIRRLVAVEGVEDIALTTNGLLLHRHAAALREAGLQRLTVSLDSMDDEAFGKMNGRGVTAEAVLRGIDAALDAGFGSVKINAVVRKGVNDHTVLEMVERFRGTKCIVRFVEYMDVGNRNRWRLDEVVSSRELRDRIHAVYPLRAADQHYRGEVAARYVYEDGAGEIGFISSVTETFCGDCTRARISADGQLYTCLFATEGADLRAPMRDGSSDDDLVELIEGIWQRRADRYSEQRASIPKDAPQRKVEMFKIGG